MDEQTCKRVKLAATFIIALFIIGIVYFFFSKAIGWFMPFFLALFVAYLAEPVVGFFEKKLRFKRAIASVITIVLTLLVLFSLLIWLVYALVIQAINFAQQLPQYMEMATQYVQNLSHQWTIFNAMLPDGMSGFLENVLITVNQNLSTIVEPLTKMTFNGARIFAASLPKMLLFTIVFILATIFISLDKTIIGRFVVRQMSPAAKENMYRVKDFMINAFFKYLKAMLIIMCITFCELLVGLTIIRVDYALLLALIICVVDIIPVLGTGTVLIPWGIIALAMGNIRMGISLLILYAVITMIRQLIEPKIVSVQIGLYPLVTLLTMYVGFKIFGVVGMFYGPFFMVFLLCLNKTGIIRLFKEEPRAEKKTPALPAKHSE